MLLESNMKLSWLKNVTWKPELLSVILTLQKKRGAFPEMWNYSSYKQKRLRSGSLNFFFSLELPSEGMLWVWVNTHTPTLARLDKCSVAMIVSDAEYQRTAHAGECFIDADCPESCRCSGSIVDCSDSGFHSVPDNIPTYTTEL